MNILDLWPKEKPDILPNDNNWFRDPNAKLLATLLSDKTKCVVEIGPWTGAGSTKFILDKAFNATVFTIDTWKGNPEMQHLDVIPVLYETFLVNCWNYKDRLYPLKMDSVQGLKLLHKEGIVPDLIYIDGDHTYEVAKYDIETAFTLFPKALIAGDDWGFREDLPVQRAVKEVANKFNLSIKIVENRAWLYI
jgi:hypothetical protein